MLVVRSLTGALYYIPMSGSYMLGIMRLRKVRTSKETQVLDTAIARV